MMEAGQRATHEEKFRTDFAAAHSDAIVATPDIVSGGK